MQNEGVTALQILAAIAGLSFGGYLFLVTMRFRKLLPQLRSAITRSRQHRRTAEVSALGREQILERARSGDPVAQYTAGRLFADEGSHKRAAAWFRRAAEAGVLDAQYCLGVALENGRGVASDLAAAFRWYQRAAELGHPMAQYNLGVALLRGNGTAPDWAAAAYWLLRAAASGSEHAGDALRWIVSNDSGQPNSTPDDLGPFIVRAERRDSNAEFLLGWSHEVGFVFPKDGNQARDWYTRAADDGHLKGREWAERLSGS
jgi:TPR repeat protein